MNMTLVGQSGLLASVCMFTNPLGMDSRGLTWCRASRRKLAQCSQFMEDITTTSPLVDLAYIKNIFQDINNSQIDNMHANVRPQGCKRRRPFVRRKIGTWMDTQLKVAMGAMDSGTSMRKKLDKSQIPYFTLHGWCYGVCTSRKRNLHLF